MPIQSYRDLEVYQRALKTEFLGLSGTRLARKGNFKTVLVRESVKNRFFGTFPHQRALKTEFLGLSGTRLARKGNF
jgi:hypothetical protein